MLVRASLETQMVKKLPAKQETWVPSLGQEDPLEKEIATDCSILAWRITWIEEPSRLQSLGLHRVRHNWSDLAQHSTMRTYYIAQELYSVLYGDLNGKEIQKRGDMCICITDSLC